MSEKCCESLLFILLIFFRVSEIKTIHHPLRAPEMLRTDLNSMTRIFQIIAKTIIAGLLISGLNAVADFADNWPQWRGREVKNKPFLKYFHFSSLI